MKKIPSLVVSFFAIFLVGCVAPQQPYRQVQGAALPTDPQPPVINQSLNGFGDLTFGMSMSDATHLGYQLTSFPDTPNLEGIANIDGFNYNEGAHFSGIPLQLTDISLQSEDQNCPTAQALFNKFSSEYGAEKTSTSNTNSSDTSTYSTVPVNYYTWTFEGGNTIILIDAEGYKCPTIDYSQAEAPEKTGSFKF
jgi:hypothetical protein